MIECIYGKKLLFTLIMNLSVNMEWLDRWPVLQPDTRGQQ